MPPKRPPTPDPYGAARLRATVAGRGLAPRSVEVNSQPARVRRVLPCAFFLDILKI